MSRPTAATRRLVRDRAGGMCEICRRDGHDLHHRQMVGMGGGGNNNASNLLMLCRACHDAVHNRPLWSREYGWLVSRWADPREVPVTLGSVVVWLDDAGGYVREVKV